MFHISSLHQYTLISVNRAVEAVILLIIMIKEQTLNLCPFNVILLN